MIAIKRIRRSDFALFAIVCLLNGLEWEPQYADRMGCTVMGYEPPKKSASNQQKWCHCAVNLVEKIATWQLDLWGKNWARAWNHPWGLSQWLPMVVPLVHIWQVAENLRKKSKKSRREDEALSLIPDTRVVKRCVEPLVFLERWSTNGWFSRSTLVYSRAMAEMEAPSGGCSLSRGSKRRTKWLCSLRSNFLSKQLAIRRERAPHICR